MTLAIVLLIVGVVLLFADVLVPTLGLLSFAGAAALLWSIGAAFGESRDTGLAFLVAVAILVPTSIFLGLRFFPRTPIGKKIVVSGLSFESTAATDVRDLDLLGKQGVALGTLRPAGHARIEGRRVDVVSRGEPIEAATPVHVVEVRGNRVVVAAIEPPLAPPPAPPPAPSN